ncbi:MAG: CRISPR-associated endonuclease Cas3'' [Burkholderiales bacterium]|jgi:CRISPR-associated endonuclease/helicase Cas3|nr:CRISPR-associated endonuclease Cas3'' [Burkholderiales bacterium]
MLGPIAHSTKDADGTIRYHGLDEHLRAVSQLAADYAAPFGGTEWARLAGLWHDLGKYRDGFQRYVRSDDGPQAHVKGEVAGHEKSHSAAGALHALKEFERRHGTKGRVASRVFAYLIASHHAGLYDWSRPQGERQDLQDRLSKRPAEREYRDAHSAAAADILQPQVTLDPALALRLAPGVAERIGDRQLRNPLAFALWVRMLFSCLVDADFLDTEAFMNPVRSTARTAVPKLEAMGRAFDEWIADRDRQLAASGAMLHAVNRVRADVLAQCRAKAAADPGLFSLTVPTGGGKTLSSLAFALDHARRHRKRRIIYAIPYTSIIEQTADVFRGVFKGLGPDAVVEHHSQAESDPKDETAASRLACENWDAPLVVTTNVQLFESLFAARTSRCRKLHNLVDSVIVLDEAQQLPPAFLQPILDTLHLLGRHYGATVVLCTATQPALSSTRYFDAAANLRGLDGVVEIIADPDALYAQLERVEVRRPADLSAPKPWTDLAAEVARQDAALVVVNRRRDARDLHALLPAGAFHLSALMCGAHRKSVLDEVKRRLAAQRDGTDLRPVHLVSTQLIEAGVDIDFPVVYRALAGLDSIAQAAGRCNREGRLRDNAGPSMGTVHVFVPPTEPPKGLLLKGAQATRSVLHGHQGSLLDRKLFERYFRQLYYQCDLDERRIVADLTAPLDFSEAGLGVSFRSAAERFKLIDDEDQTQIIVRWRGDGEEGHRCDALIGKLLAEKPKRWLARALQRYSVSVPARTAMRLVADGSVREVFPGWFVQQADGAYDETLGLRVDEEVFDPVRNAV